MGMTPLHGLTPGAPTPGGGTVVPTGAGAAAPAAAAPGNLDAQAMDLQHIGTQDVLALQTGLHQHNVQTSVSAATTQLAADIHRNVIDKFA